MDLQKKIVNLKRVKELLKKALKTKSDKIPELRKLFRKLLDEIKREREDSKYNRELIVGQLDSIYDARRNPIRPKPDWRKYSNRELNIHLDNVKSGRSSL